ncbi:MAG: UDP-N-acetylmuramoyl-L-alanine--D-glutamate ligase [Solirubrobacteraceae bacterium]
MTGSRPALPRGPFLVAGLARSGAAAARALTERGEEVIGVDSGSPAAQEFEFEHHLDTDGVGLVARARTLIKSPGVPGEAPVLRAARAGGLAILGELELAWRLLGAAHEWIAVTGTNGKTTTVELIGAIHREAALPVAVAGNVGRPLSALSGKLSADATIVCEASSFQLEDTLEFAPEAAVLLNVAADHLDRHGTLAAYRAAKLEIFARQGNHDVAVAPESERRDDLGGCARRVWFGSGPEAELSDRAGQLWWCEEPLVAHGDIRLRGAHNRLNAMAAAAACLARGVDPEAVRAGLRSFAGVSHRLEEVAVHDGVLFVNDSKATNVASTLVALRAFEAPRRGIHLILGGQGKGQDFTPLREVVARSCSAVYVVGEDAPRLVSALDGASVAVRQSGDLARAVQDARSAAQPGEVVLLSPACASLDQWEDFEARGDAFRQLTR